MFIVSINFYRGDEMMNYMDLHKNSYVVDAHSDIPLHMLMEKGRKGSGDILISKHLPLLKQGGVNLVFVNTFENLHPEGSLKEALIEISEVYRQLENTEEAMFIRTKGDLDEAISKNKIGLVLSMEGMEPISNELGLIDVFYELGLRSAMLTWNWRNYFAAGVSEGGGLSRLGKDAILKMEKLGIIVDVSHLNEEGFWDIIDLVKNPIIASHSNAKAVYNHERNLTDEQIKAIAKTGGVIGLNGYFTEDKEKESIESFMKHLEYILKLAGEDHVGLGFDFNEYLGSKGTKDLEDCTKIPIVTKELLNRGYSESTIRKILGENFVRVLKNILPS